jgi:hypothetical protein
LDHLDVGVGTFGRRVETTERAGTGLLGVAIDGFDDLRARASTFEALAVGSLTKNGVRGSRIDVSG